MSAWDAYYPRPQMCRESFYCLNGLNWTLNGRPIRLPFPPQSKLSGYEGEIGETLHYAAAFTLPEGFCKEGQRVILHLGAVDQLANVTVNGQHAACHEGGYLPFSADITALLQEGENELRIEAVDRLDPDIPYGKQSKNPHGMWYTPVSGVWQSVWLEAVPKKYIRSLRITPLGSAR